MSDQTSRDISRIAMFLVGAEASGAPVYGNISATEALDGLARIIGQPADGIRQLVGGPAEAPAKSRIIRPA